MATTRKRQVSIATHLSPQECVERLKAVCGTPRIFSLAEIGYYGQFGRTGFKIWWASGMRNSWQHIFTARFLHDPMQSRTVIVGQSAPHDLIRAFMWVWFGGLGMFAAIILLVLMANPKPGDYYGLLIVGGMALFGLGLNYTGNYFGGQHDAETEEFIRQTVEGDFVE